MDEATKLILKQTQEAINRAVEDAKKRRNEEDRKFIVSQIGKDLADILKPLMVEIASNSKLNKAEFRRIVDELKIEKIEIKSPDVKVTVPEIKLPEIKIPPIIVPKSEIIVNPKINFPKEMEVKGIAGYFKTLVQAFTGELNVGLEKIDRDNPLIVTLVDKNGAYYTAGGAVTVMGKGGKVINEVDNETPAGTIDGSNQEFTLAHSPIPSSSLKLFLNGMYQSPVGEDYTLHDNVIDFLIAPPSGSILRAFYKY